jgi:hypothetical protein
LYNAQVREAANRRQVLQRLEVSMRVPLALALPAAVLALAAGCSDTMISVSSDGRIEVAVSTTGADVDLDGFSVSVDGGVEQFVAPGARVTLAHVAPGSHSVRLSGLAENCHVVGSNPRAVVVGLDGTATMDFEVSCSRPATGGFTIIVGTAGGPADPDGYILAVAGGGLRPIGTSATETFTDLVPGVHLVTLKDVAEGCALAGGNPQPFTVVAGKTVQIRLTVNCGSPL